MTDMNRLRLNRSRTIHDQLENIRFRGNGRIPFSRFKKCCMIVQYYNLAALEGSSKNTQV